MDEIPAAGPAALLTGDRASLRRHAPGGVICDGVREGQRQRHQLPGPCRDHRQAYGSPEMEASLRDLELERYPTSRSLRTAFHGIASKRERESQNSISQPHDAAPRRAVIVFLVISVGHQEARLHKAVA